jgi:hypothetical protein
VTQMSDQSPKDKAEVTVKKLKGRKPREYLAFEEMLRRVVKSPPLRKKPEPRKR